MASHSCDSLSLASTRPDDSENEFPSIHSGHLGAEVAFNKAMSPKRNADEREKQLARLRGGSGFMAGLDPDDDYLLRADAITSSVLRGCRISDPTMKAKTQAALRLVSRVVSSASFDARAIAAVLCEGALSREVGGLSIPQFLWAAKRIVPFVKAGAGLADDMDNMELNQYLSQMDELLGRAVVTGCLGAKSHCVLKVFSRCGIQALVRQQFQVARRILSKGLMPILSFDVDMDKVEKDQCEHIMVDVMLSELRALPASCEIIFQLSIPERPNLYLPLSGHPRTLQLVALSGRRSQAASCKALAENKGMIAGFGSAFLENLDENMTREDFDRTLDESCERLCRASTPLSQREWQIARVSLQDGFFAALDQREQMQVGLQAYGIDAKQFSTDEELVDCLHQKRSRILQDPAFDGSRVLAAILFEASLDRKIDGVPSAQYLWEQKRIVPLLNLDKGLAEEKDGVQLMTGMFAIGVLMDKGASAGIFGVKQRSIIKRFNRKGIKSIVEQQFEIARCAIANGLVPILEPEVDLHAPDKQDCEQLLLDLLLAGLRQMNPEDRLIFKLTMPTQPNLYLPLIAHPCTMRVVGIARRYSLEDDCKILTQNDCIVASFSRGLKEGLHISQSSEEFSAALNKNCEAIFQCSRKPGVREMQRIRIRQQDGFFVTVDQCIDTTPETLFQPSKEDCDKKHRMRSRIITNPMFEGSRVLGAIMSEATLDHEVAGGQPPAKYLWEKKRIVTFLRLPAREEKDGVFFFQDIEGLQPAIAKARDQGVFGVKARSVISRCNESRIRECVRQQFQIAEMVVEMGMVPILCAEVLGDMPTAEKASCEKLLVACLLEGLQQLRPEQQVMFTFTLPTEPNLYLPLMGHPSTLRLLALCGGYHREEACRKLTQNYRIVASFAMAFSEGLHELQGEKEFTRTLDQATEAIFRASCDHSNHN